MILISHRGNINGKNHDLENNPSYIEQALSRRYEVEVDVRYSDGDLYLGHDSCQHKVNEQLLCNKRVWCHAKDIDSLYRLLAIKAHCFFHQSDAATLTSQGFIWTFPGERLTPDSICVLPELSNNWDFASKKCLGICSDFIEKFRK